MKITIEKTIETVTLVVNGYHVPARVWLGETDEGQPVQCFTTRIDSKLPQDNPQLAESTRIIWLTEPAPRSVGHILSALE